VLLSEGFLDLPRRIARAGEELGLHVQGRGIRINRKRIDLRRQRRAVRVMTLGIPLS
jgi:hypothetical protein